MKLILAAIFLLILGQILSLEITSHQFIATLLAIIIAVIGMFKKED